MPIRYETNQQTDPESGQPNFHVQFSGTITPMDIESYLDEVSTVLENWEGIRALAEFDRTVTLKAFNYNAVLRLAGATKRYQQALGGSITAIVAPGPLVFGLSRMYKALRDPPYALGIFRSREPAIDWLKQETALRSDTAKQDQRA